MDEPRIFLLDEPTAALDAASAGLVEELLKYLLVAGRCILLASHDQGLIGRLSDARLQLAPMAAANSPGEAVALAVGAIAR